MNPAPARAVMVYADDERFLGFLVVRDGTFLAVNLSGNELGPFRTQDCAVAALSRRRRFETSRRREVLPLFPARDGARPS